MVDRVANQPTLYYAAKAGHATTGQQATTACKLHVFNT